MKNLINNLSLNQKTAGIFGVILAFVVLTSLTTIWGILNTHSGIEQNKKLALIASEINHAEKDAIESRKKLLQFISTGETSYRDEYSSNVKKFTTDVEQIQKSAYYTVLPSGIKDSFLKSVDLFQKWQKNIVSKQLEYAKNPYTFDTAKVVEYSKENVAYWQEIDTTFEKINKEVEAIVEAQIESQTKALNFVQLITIIASMIVVAACVGAYIIINTTVVNPVKRITEKFVLMSQYDLTLEKVDVTSKDEIGKLSESFNQLLDRFKTIINSVKSTTNQMAAASEEMSSTMKGIMGTMESQTESSNQISVAVQDSSKQSQEVNNLSSSSQHNIIEMTSKSSDAEGSMKLLKDNSDRIVNVLGVINDIADQVNLLALNAAIEAARAGDAGRGFAVVAEEVKKLAESVSKSTSEVQGEISGLGVNVNKTSEALGGITNSLQTVHSEASKVTEAIEHQSSAIEEISSSVDSFSQQVSALSHAIKEMEEVSHSIANEASKLDDEVAQFKT